MFDTIENRCKIWARSRGIGSPSSNSWQANKSHASTLGSRLGGLYVRLVHDPVLPIPNATRLDWQLRQNMEMEGHYVHNAG